MTMDNTHVSIAEELFLNRAMYSQISYTLCDMRLKNKESGLSILRPSMVHGPWKWFYIAAGLKTKQNVH